MRTVVCEICAPIVRYKNNLEEFVINSIKNGLIGAPNEVKLKYISENWDKKVTLCDISRRT